MARERSPPKRPYQRVMDELGADLVRFDLEKHIRGCFAGYQNRPDEGTAVYFALEMLSGIAIHGRALESQGLTPQLETADGAIRTNAAFSVPWFSITVLAAAWETYKQQGPPLGKAFGLEGSQGKRPVIEQLEKMLDQRSIAHFVARRAQQLRAARTKKPIQTAKNDAADHFELSDETVDRAWKRFGRIERERARKRA